MKKKRTRHALPLVLIALLLPAFVYTAWTAWGIWRQSDDEQSAFDALARRVAAETSGERETGGGTPTVSPAQRAAAAMPEAMRDGETVTVDLRTLDVAAGTANVTGADGARETVALDALDGLVLARWDGEIVAADVRDYAPENGTVAVCGADGDWHAAALDALTFFYGRRVARIDGMEESVDFATANVAADTVEIAGEEDDAVRTARLREVLEAMRTEAAKDGPGTSEPNESSEADPQDGEAAEDAGEKPREVLAEYRALHDENADFFGWLRIDDTAIDYPVMYTPEEPERYLHLDFEGSYSYSGTPFIEGNCLADGNYYIIYAHHMKNGTMFGALPRYAEKTYWEEHPVIHFDTLYERRDYRVVAAFTSKVYGERETGVFRYYEYTDLSAPERFESYMEGALSAALYDTGVEAAYGDDILTLSTCNYHTENGRFVVVAKRIWDDVGLS